MQKLYGLSPVFIPESASSLFVQNPLPEWPKAVQMCLAVKGLVVGTSILLVGKRVNDPSQKSSKVDFWIPGNEPKKKDEQRIDCSRDKSLS